jgi:regulator of sigma E protease
MLTVVAFVSALALLITVHEYGHYRMAVACGVKVLRFSIGFGRPLLVWRNAQGTEFVVAALPLGGYVRMLDEGDGQVSPADAPKAFNRQPLKSKAAIVAAGPVANFVLAVALYALVSWSGVSVSQPVMSTPAMGSLAERAGIRSGQWVLAVQGELDDSAEPVQSFEDVRWQLTRAAMAKQNLILWIAERADANASPVRLALSEINASEPDAALMEEIGLLSPWQAPVLTQIADGSAAQRAGLLANDRVLAVDTQPVDDAQQLRMMIRRAVDAQGQAQTQTWVVERSDQVLTVEVKPDVVEQTGFRMGRLGAFIGSAPDSVIQSYGVLDSFVRGVERTWEMATLTLDMLWRMVTGQASLKHLSGPLTIADYAGKSASMGWTPYLLFLALISVSLGVLNLLPLPMLDGGHLMYYLWEAVTGRPVTEVWMHRLQRGGFVVLMGLMSLAIFNDVARLMG